jgi:hypothetical protein
VKKCLKIDPTNVEAQSLLRSIKGKANNGNI